MSKFSDIIEQVYSKARACKKATQLPDYKRAIMINQKQQKGEGLIWAILAIVAVVLFIFFLAWLWRWTHQSVWHAIIFWTIVASPFIIWLSIKFRSEIAYGIERLWLLLRGIEVKYDSQNSASTKNNLGGNWEDETPKNTGKTEGISDSEWEYPNFRNAQQSGTYDSEIISYIKSFKPQWELRNGKRRLEGTEVGVNAMLAQYLRGKGIARIITECYLKDIEGLDVNSGHQTSSSCQ